MILRCRRLPLAALRSHSPLSSAALRAVAGRARRRARGGDLAVLHGLSQRGGARSRARAREYRPRYPAAQRAIWEKVIHKLDAGLMPPPGEPRPSQTVASLVAYLETTLDARAPAGRRPAAPVEPHGVRQCGPRLARIPVDVDVAAARGHLEPRLRQRLGHLKTSPLLLERYLTVGLRVAATGGRRHQRSRREGGVRPRPIFRRTTGSKGCRLERAAGSSSTTTSRPMRSTSSARSFGRRPRARSAEWRGSRRPSSSRF